MVLVVHDLAFETMPETAPHQDERRRRSYARSQRPSSRAPGAAAKEIRAPMPGRVVKVLVDKGQDVAAQAPIIVMEAMKMENELRATTAGKVADIRVKAGDNVEGGAVLVQFE